MSHRLKAELRTEKNVPVCSFPEIALKVRTMIKGLWGSLMKIPLPAG
ncbi:Uncharacterized protein dnm_090870 [Desulfonema magnum]|uniref:Uncharacterized protein n=1 Tax=Desulfonema magnum TaxID=45655 RepID=A0A975BXI3_9BACT|nr:Uncharacterized protein dnm_090870 [Desulfonema magnum]